MRVKTIKSVCYGSNTLDPGEVIELDGPKAEELISKGTAVETKSVGGLMCGPLLYPVAGRGVHITGT